MATKILSGRSNPGLAGQVARRLGTTLGQISIDDFPDGELHVELNETVRGFDVIVLQPTSPPVANNLIELLLICDACRRAGALKISVLVPYFGYARQDRNTTGCEPVSAKVVADLLGSAHIERVIVVDIHNPAIEGFFAPVLTRLSAVSLLADAARLAGASVVVSPDLGGVNIADRYGAALGLPVAIVHKERISGEKVAIHSITGEVKGKKPLVVDDMISTGGTIQAAVEALLEAGCEPEITVAATHGLLVGPAADRLKNLPIHKIYLTNSTGLRLPDELSIEEIDLSPVLADAIGPI